VSKGPDLHALVAQHGTPLLVVDCDVVRRQYRALHDALSALEVLDPRQARIVELKYFGGLTEQEVARAMALSVGTIRREIVAARFWLGRRMSGEP
jgi:DNA-directed RNA polymerase specialized sigma24 family protein